MSDITLRAYRVWDLPIRWFHWINFPPRKLRSWIKVKMRKWRAADRERHKLFEKAQ